MAVSVIIPAYNEEKNVGKTVVAAFHILGVTQVVVVDDGSRDATSRAAREAGALVVKLAANTGKGAALNHGLSFLEGDIALLLDADLGATAMEAWRLVEPVISGHADMTVACLPPAGPSGGFGLVKTLATHGVHLFGGPILEAPLSGQRALTRDLLQKVAPLAPGFGVEVDLNIKVARLGCRIMEIAVPISHQGLGKGLPGFRHRGRQLLDVARALAHCAVAQR